jgi:hypothetical protein
LGAQELTSASVIRTTSMIDERMITPAAQSCSIECRHSLVAHLPSRSVLLFCTWRIDALCLYSALLHTVALHAIAKCTSFAVITQRGRKGRMKRLLVGRHNSLSRALTSHSSPEFCSMFWRRRSKPTRKGALLHDEWVQTRSWQKDCKSRDFCVSHVVKQAVIRDGVIADGKGGGDSRDRPHLRKHAEIVNGFPNFAIGMQPMQPMLFLNPIPAQHQKTFSRCQNLFGIQSPLCLPS